MVEQLTNRFIWLALFATVGLGAVGFADDYLKLKRQTSAGLTARMTSTSPAAGTGSSPERSAAAARSVRDKAYSRSMVHCSGCWLRRA